ncbi:DUF427 domain-containing protein [Amycolatopsis sp. NPDC051903]|uniref:DUF427 domain-containing protein n=1 Tax=Amycolatopsis sp. NPDC051903 TaxID=3363936 RepID=UPI0037987423
MGLSWHQGPLAPDAAGRFLTTVPLPERMPFAEPLGRRMRVRFAGTWIADSEDVVLLHEPSRHPVAYFAVEDILEEVLVPARHTTHHQDWGKTTWYDVRTSSKSARHAAYRHTDLPDYADDLRGRVAFVGRAMESFFEEDDQILGPATDPYHRVDIRRADRHLTVAADGRIIADTKKPLVSYESNFAPRWFVPRTDIDLDALTLMECRTVSPYKGDCSYYAVLGRPAAAWSYERPPTEVQRLAGLVSFEPSSLEVRVDEVLLATEPEQPGQFEHVAAGPRGGRTPGGRA